MRNRVFVSVAVWMGLAWNAWSIPIPVPAKKPAAPQQSSKGVAKPKEKALTVVNNPWVSIPEGCFDMGSNDGDSDEKPVHRVCLGEFQIKKFETTQGEFQKVMGNNPSDFKSCGGNCPVESVDWFDAKEYCRRIGGRLPTEAEWEYAARAGSTSKWYWGNGESDANRYAWYDANSGDKTHPVGGKYPNDWGLYDMAGNVWEWTADWYGPYSSGQQQDPIGAASGSSRVSRGGSWNSGASNLRSSFRYSSVPSNRYIGLGFRCAL